MSNVTPIAPLTSYSEPDFSLIAQSTKDISRLAVFQTEKLMSVMDKAQRASGYALDLDKVMGEGLVNSMLFSMTDWSAKGIAQHGVSNGKLKGNESTLLPLIPTAFIVAKDVTIKANFTAQDTSRFTSESSSSESNGWGWGPFSGGGRYFKSRAQNDTFKSSYSNGVLKLPGLQLIAWVSTITPASPPKAG